MLWYAIALWTIEMYWRNYFSTEMKFLSVNQQRPISFDIISIGTIATINHKNCYFGGHNRAQWAIDRIPNTLAEMKFYYAF